MNTPPNPADYLKSSVALVPGLRPRTVAIAASTDQTLGPKIPPSHWLARVERPLASAVVDVFLTAVGMGCFTTLASGAPSLRRHDKRQTGDLVHETWEVAFPAVPEGAFDALLRMAECTAMNANGLTTLSLIEQAPHDLPRVAREGLHPLEGQAWPFAVDNTVGEGERKEMSILVTFVDDATETTLEATRTLFETWGRVLAWGGFPPVRWNPCSTGFVTDVSGHLPEEVVAQVEFFTGTNEAWHALCRGLARVHVHAGVSRVEIG
jgi:hypothetical protein